MAASAKLREWQRIYGEIRDDILAYCRYMGHTPTAQQRDFYLAVQREHKIGKVNQLSKDWKGRVGVCSGQGPGKTRGSVIAGGWRTLQRRNAKTVVTAPTMRQCEQWIEDFKLALNSAHPVLKDAFKCYKRKIEVLNHETWEIVCATATKAENIQGSHRENQTIIMDEASGIGRPIWEATKGTLSDYNPMLLAIGNPNSRDCEFFDVFNRNKDEWVTMRWDARKSSRVSPANIQKIIREYGIESNVFRVRVAGLFPLADPDVVLPYELVEAAAAVNPLLAVRHTKVLSSDRAISYDFARMGGDENVVMTRQGLAITKMWFKPNCDPVHAVRKGFRLQRDLQWRDDECLHIFDCNGMGEGLAHLYHEHEKEAFEFKNQKRARHSRQYNDIMTEAFFEFKRLLQTGRASIPDDPQLLRQLSSRRYIIKRDGRLELESKEDYVKRRRKESTDDGNLSPDRADAAVMSFYDPLRSNENSVSMIGGPGDLGASYRT